jgi:lipopolysaccharide export system permease protein
VEFITNLNDTLINNFDADMHSRILQNSMRIARSNKAYYSNAKAQYDWRKTVITRHVLEWQKKFSVSFAVIVLFFVGAPLGAIIRKGGMGMPVVVSVFIFIIYHVTSFSFEKLGRFMYWTPFQAMWTANFILLPIGIWLTYKSATDSVIFNIELYMKPFQKISNIFAKRKSREASRENSATKQ